MRYDSTSVGGVCLEIWFDAFYQCHENSSSGLMRMCWPDGRCYLEQENLVVEMFALIREEYNKSQEKVK